MKYYNRIAQAAFDSLAGERHKFYGVLLNCSYIIFLSEVMKKADDYFKDWDIQDLFKSNSLYWPMLYDRSACTPWGKALAYEAKNYPLGTVIICHPLMLRPEDLPFPATV